LLVPDIFEQAVDEAVESLDFDEWLGFGID